MARSLAVLSALFVALITPGSCLSQTYTIKTISGGGLPENIPPLSASIGAVTAIATDAAGNGYIALTEYHIVVRSDTSGRLIRVAGSGTAGFDGDEGPATSAHLASPRGLAVDSAGNLYIADSGNNRIRKVSGGVITTVAGGGAALGDGGPATDGQLKGPTGIAVDSEGRTYIADTNNHLIRMVSAGIIATVAGNGTAGYSGDGGPGGDAQLSSPTGVALDSTGANLYIADSGNKCIRRLDISSRVISRLTGSFPSATAVAVDKSGAIYVADPTANVVRKIVNGVASPFAGTGKPGYNGDYMSPTAAMLTAPGGVAVDPEGRVYIADTGNGLIRQVGPQPSSLPGPTPVLITSVAGYTLDPSKTEGPSIGDNGPATSAQLRRPQHVAAGPGGSLYIADLGNLRVRKVSADVIVTVAGDGLPGFRGDGGSAGRAGLNGPAGVAVDAAGDLYIADINDGRIRKVSNGTITTVAGGGSTRDGDPLSVQLDQPIAVALDSAGSLYIAESQINNSVRQVSGGVLTTFAGTGARGFRGDDGPAASALLNQPHGVAADAAGSVYIADFGNNRIRKVTDGVIRTVVGDGVQGYGGDEGPAGDARLAAPADVAVDAAGNLYIADSGNSRIRRVSGGLITTIAGTGVPGFSGDDGPAGSAQLNGPTGIAIDSAGNLLVADNNNHRIRLLIPSGPPCAYSVSPTLLTAGIAGGDYTVRIDTAPSCPWAISGLPAWVTMAGQNAAAGPATVTLKVAATGAGSRSVNISIAGIAVRVSQEGPACTYVITPPSLNLTTAGGGVSVTLETPLSCPWTISSTPSFVTVSGPASGSGPASLSFVVEGTTNVSRGANIVIAGITVPVVQQAASCAYSVPNSVSVSAGGGNFTARIDTGPSCAWAISGLPAWVTLSGSSFGAGPATVTLSAAASGNGPRTAFIVIANVMVLVEQKCAYAIYPGGQAFPPEGGTGSFDVTTSAGCPWTVAPSSFVTFTGPLSGSGGGRVTFMLAPRSNSGISFTIAVAGLYFQVTQPAPSGMGYTVGTMAQVAFGGGWKTAITLVNPGPGIVTTRLSLNGNDGIPLALPVTRLEPAILSPFPTPTGGPLVAAQVQDQISPNGSMVIESEESASQAPRAGWGQVQTDADFKIGGFAIFSQKSDAGTQEAVVPIENRNAASYFLWFDNTAPFVTGIAMANVAAQAASAPVVIRDESGKVIGQEQVELPAHGHDAFVLPDRFQATAQRRGALEFRTPLNGRVSVLGLRFNGSAFTTIPVIVPSAGSSAADLGPFGTMAHLASGGTWKTAITLVNTGSSQARSRLNFFDNAGAALTLPVSFPATPSTAAIQASSVDQTLAPGASVVIETAGSDAQDAQTGWVQMLADNPSVGGFAIFRQRSGAGEQEAVVPLETRDPSSFLLWFDNTSPFVNGVAAANNSLLPASVPVTARDASGKLIGQQALSLPARGHDAFVLAERFPFTAGRKGTLEFARPAGGQVSVLGLRFNGSAFTSIPAVVK